MSKRTFFSVPSNGLVLGILLGAVALVVMTIFNWPSPHDESTAIKVGSPSDVSALIDDWSVMERGTYAVTSTYTRTLTNGQTFSTAQIRVQRPPDSVDVANGTITSVRNGTRSVCSMDTNGNTGNCRSESNYDDAAAKSQELDGVRALVTGPDAMYQVSERNDYCHELQLTTVGLSQPVSARTWGSAAVFCFDPRTGAMVSSRITRDGGIDVTTATNIVATVTDADLDAAAATRS